MAAHYLFARTESILARLAVVIYLGCTGLTVLLLLLAVWFGIPGVIGGAVEAELMAVYLAICAALAWLFGRGCLYVLANR
jgi:Asp/Glu/hydantoin racemase